MSTRERKLEEAFLRLVGAIDRAETFDDDDRVQRAIDRGMRLFAPGASTLTPERVAALRGEVVHVDAA